MHPESHPYKRKACRREKAVFAQMLWDCIKNPDEAKAGRIQPLLEAATTRNNEEQQRAAQQSIEALARRKSGEPATASADLRRNSVASTNVGRDYARKCALQELMKFFQPIQFHL